MKVQKVNVGNVLTPTSGFMRDCGFDFALNTAFGCGFGCSYCYAAAFTQKFSPGEAWGQWTKLKVNAGQLIAGHASLTGKKIYMASMTDPYQPSEREAGVTRAALEALLAHHQGFTLVVQTRSKLVLRDLDLLQAIAEIAAVQVNVTISTDCEATRRVFEPTCPSIAQRLEAIRGVANAGLEAVVTASPMLPVGDVEGFAQTLAEINLQKVVIQHFHAPQAGRELVRGTRSEAEALLSDRGITHASLVAQGRALQLALERRGMRVAVGKYGFKAP